METLYGRNAVLEALRAARRRFRQIIVAEGIRRSDTVVEMLRLAEERSIPIHSVERHRLEELGDVNHQGVAADVDAYPYVALGAMLDRASSREEPPLLLLLDCLQDPQNLGTLLRTAEAVAVHGVLIPDRRAAQITPAVSNASAGAVEHLLIGQVTNLVRAMEELKSQGVWVVGLEQTAQAGDYRATDLNMPLALVIGSEGQGLRRLVRERCDLLIELPMRGKINSLNASVAGSIALYEAWQQRRNT
jgi:23S rRNA (guanosine2251-2'-O)-methyltransferase